MDTVPRRWLRLTTYGGRQPEAYLGSLNRIMQSAPFEQVHDAFGQAVDPLGWIGRCAEMFLDHLAHLALDIVLHLPVHDLSVWARCSSSRPAKAVWASSGLPYGDSAASRAWSRASAAGRRWQAGLAQAKLLGRIRPAAYILSGSNIFNCAAASMRLALRPR